MAGNFKAKIARNVANSAINEMSGNSVLELVADTKKNLNTDKLMSQGVMSKSEMIK